MDWYLTRVAHKRCEDKVSLCQCPTVSTDNNQNVSGFSFLIKNINEIGYPGGF